MDYLDLNIPDWKYLGFESKEEYEEYKYNEKFLIEDINRG